MRRHSNEYQKSEHKSDSKTKRNGLHGPYMLLMPTKNLDSILNAAESKRWERDTKEEKKRGIEKRKGEIERH